MDILNIKMAHFQCRFYFLRIFIHLLWKKINSGGQEVRNMEQIWEKIVFLLAHVHTWLSNSSIKMRGAPICHLCDISYIRGYTPLSGVSLASWWSEKHLSWSLTLRAHNNNFDCKLVLDNKWWSVEQVWVDRGRKWAEKSQIYVVFSPVWVYYGLMRQNFIHFVITTIVQCPISWQLWFLCDWCLPFSVLF